MNIHEPLNSIIEIFSKGNESEMYICTVRFLFDKICKEKENDSYEMKKHFESAILIHNRLRYKHNADFNGPLLSWYRRFIGLYGDEE